MRRLNAEVWGSLAVAFATLAAIGLVATSPTALPWGSLLTATLAVAASAWLLIWVASDGRTLAGRGSAWVCGLVAALVVGLGSAADYLLWFSDSRLWTVGCHVLALGIVASAGWKSGWTGGFRAALVANLGATTIVLTIFWWNLGVPVQAAVFQANGMLDSYAASPVTAFVRWVSDAFLFSVLPRTLAALAAGVALGWAVGWVKKRFNWTSSPGS